MEIWRYGDRCRYRDGCRYRDMEIDVDIDRDRYIYNIFKHRIIDI